MTGCGWDSITHAWSPHPNPARLFLVFLLSQIMLHLTQPLMTLRDKTPQRSPPAERSWRVSNLCFWWLLGPSSSKLCTVPAAPPALPKDTQVQDLHASYRKTRTAPHGRKTGTRGAMYAIYTLNASHFLPLTQQTGSPSTPPTSECPNVFKWIFLLLMPNNGAEI